MYSKNQTNGQSQKLRAPISHANLRQGYEMAVANGLRICELALEIGAKFPDKALALAQVGQKRLGSRSLCLRVLLYRKILKLGNGFGADGLRTNSKRTGLSYTNC